MKLEKIMSTSVVSVDMDDSLRIIRGIFDQEQFHHLLVVDQGKLFGLISDRDLLRELSPNMETDAETTRDIAILNKRAHQIMTRNPITLTAEAGIYDAIEIFNRNAISCIPIIDEEERPVGVISWRDILKAVEGARTPKKQPLQNNTHNQFNVENPKESVSQPE